MDEKAPKTNGHTQVDATTALRRTAIFFGSAIIVAVVMRLVCYNGLIGGGDIGIIETARNVNAEIWPSELHPFLNKFGLLLPLALTFKLFGTAEWAQMSVPLLASLGSVALAFFVARRAFSTTGRKEYGDIAGFLAAIIVAVNPLDIIMGTWIRWEALFAFAAAAGIGFLYLAYREKRIIFLLLSAVGVGWAYLTHNWGAAVFLFGFIALLSFAISKKIPFFYPIIWSAIIALFVLGEAFAWHSINGDALFAWRFALEPAIPRFPELPDIISRLGMGFAATTFWGLKGIGITLAVGIAASIFLLIRRQWEYLIWVLWATIILLWADFGSDRFSVYNPAILTPKLLLPTLFPLAIIISAAFTRFIIEPEAERALQRWAGAIAIGIIIALMAVHGGKGGFIISLAIYPLLLLFPVLFLGLARRIKSVETAFSANLGAMGVIALTVVLITVPTVYLKFNRVEWIGNERAIAEYCTEYSINRIYTDNMTKRTIDYLYGYKGDIEVLDYEENNHLPEPGEVYVVNYYKIWRARFVDRPEPVFVGKLDDWERIYVIEGRSPKPAVFYRVP